MTSEYLMERQSCAIGIDGLGMRAFSGKRLPAATVVVVRARLTGG